MADQGTGVSISFSSGYLATATSMTMRLTREEIDITTLATTGGKDFAPSDLYSGEIDAEFLFVPGTESDITAGTGAGNCTVTFSDAGAGNYTMQAFHRDLEITVAPDDRVRGSATLRITGDVTHTA